MEQRVFVGLSGGVDSGTSAALLQEQGYDVVGVFIKIWQPEFIECTWREDRLDAMRIAAALGIPFREIDLSDEYKTEVVDSMVRDYERGITPNPDVLCNEKIKFGHFARWAFENGAELIATGHYAQVQMTDGEAQLLRGVDPQKDQSYFLNRIGQKELARTIFPIGAMRNKEAVRAEAARFGLGVAAKPDSQGLCFVGDVSMKDFLGRFMILASGDVLDTHGNVIGKHDGAALYTIGQRHGFTLGKPGLPSVIHYVIATSIRDNTITVSPDRSLGAVEQARLRDMHWIGSGEKQFPLKLLAQSRYRETPFPITLREQGDDIMASFEEPHLASSGQSLVVYDGDTCLGGGIIERL